jgi:membrane-associated protease RseP (regulator of RpoE activity)
MKSTSFRSRILVLTLSAVSSFAFQQPITITTRRTVDRGGHFKDLSPHSTTTNAYTTSPFHPSRISKSRPNLSRLNLSPSAALSSVASPIGSLAVLAFVILVHEAGHFIAARSLGIDVDEFSVGVGPRILGARKRWNEGQVSWEWIQDLNGEEEEDASRDGSIEFSLRALPLGGYVRFPPSYNQTLAFEGEDAARKARDEARLLRVENASSLEKTLEFLAAKSFVSNAMSLGLLKKWAAGREEEQLRQAEEELLLESKTDTSSSKSWWSAMPWNSNMDKDPESDFSKLDSARSKLELIKAGKSPEIEYYDDPNLLQNRQWQERAIVLSGGVVFNIILAFLCYFGELTAGRGLPRPVFDSGAVVSATPSVESPAYGVLKRGDIILGVNGK